MRLPAWLSPEVASFLAVGGTGYVVDVAGFNLLRSDPGLAAIDPTYSRIIAVAVAMVITYLGNRLLTWRHRNAGDLRREVLLFIAFNIIGMGFSVACLLVSHDVLGLTTRLDDNISANLVGLSLGTLFRFWSYRSFVFAEPAPGEEPEQEKELVP